MSTNIGLQLFFIWLNNDCRQHKQSLCKYFVLPMSVIMIIKIMFLTKTDGYQKLFDTKKNVTKTVVFIKGVYCIMCL